MLPNLFLLPIGVAGLIALTVYLVGLENKDERHKTFIILMTVLLIDATLAGHASNTPIGILRPQVAGQDFRPPDLIIVSAVTAKLISGRKKQFAPEQLLLVLFLCWYATGAIIGIRNGFRVQQVLFQGKTAFYMFGGVLIASGANLTKLAAKIGKWGERLAVVVLIATIFEVFSIVIQFSTPIQRFNRFGQLGNDSITLYTAIGLMVLAVESHRPQPRLRTSAAGTILVLAPLAGQQRASYLVLAVVVTIGLILGVSKTFSVRRTVSPIQIFLGGAAMVALLLTATIAGNGASVVTTRLNDAFAGEAEANSAAARVDLADQALNRIAERPLLGWGLGATVTRTAIQGGKTAEAAAHNVILDLLMRSGFGGFTLFLVALGAMIRRALLRWRGESNNMTAGLQVGAILTIGAFLAKAMVEPAFDKYRLTLMAAVAFGLILAEVGPAETQATPNAEAKTEAEIRNGGERAAGLGV